MSQVEFYVGSFSSLSPLGYKKITASHVSCFMYLVWLSAQERKISALKKNDKIGELGGDRGVPLTTFHSYDLDELRVPIEARPLAGDVHLGKHGYTLRSSSGAAPRSLNNTLSHILLSQSDHPNTFSEAGRQRTYFPMALSPWFSLVSP